MAKYIERDKVYELIGQTGVARVHVSDIDTLPTVDIDPESIRPHGRWINPYEQLPMAEEVVLVIVSGKPKRNITLDNAYELASFSVDEGWILEEWPEWEDPDVKYWIPLPEPPKEVICDE